MKKKSKKLLKDFQSEKIKNKLLKNLKGGGNGITGGMGFDIALLK